MDIVSVIVAAAAAFIWGAIWYTINGSRWAAAIGKTQEEIKADKNPMPYIIAGLVALVTAGMMRHIFYMAGIANFQEGIIAGLGTGAFIAAPYVIIHYSFGGRPKALWWIDGLHTTIAVGIIGGVLGAFA